MALQPQAVPLFEFDGSKEKFSPAHYIPAELQGALPKKCVLAFMNKELEAFAREHSARLLTSFHCCTCELPIYVLEYEGEEIALTTGLLGGAGVVGQLEELICMGAKTFVVCGAAGTLTPSPLGALVVVSSAVRDEGTSFHYAPASYTLEANTCAVRAIEKTLSGLKVPFVTGKTWTTDAIYRETEEKISLRRSQGCITVEMEAAALMAVAALRKITLGQILYCGDDLSGEGYDTRGFTRAEIRKTMVELAVQCVKNM